MSLRCPSGGEDADTFPSPEGVYAALDYPSGLGYGEVLVTHILASRLDTALLCLYVSVVRPTYQRQSSCPLVIA